MFDKYQLIDSIIVQVDALTDMRGVEKCRVIIDIIGKLAALKKGLQDDDVRTKEKIDELKAASGDEETIQVGLCEEGGI